VFEAAVQRVCKRVNIESPAEVRGGVLIPFVETPLQGKPPGFLPRRAGIREGRRRFLITTAPGPSLCPYSPKCLEKLFGNSE
jgi:hypothetical protein